MPLGTVASLKDSPGYQPLILAAFTFQGTSPPQLLVSTHPLNSSEGGPSFPGIGVLPAGDYLGRLMAQDLDAIQQRSQLGIDRIAKVSLHLADPDYYIWTNFAKVYGFRGASVQLCLVMWQAGTNNFSSDAPILFVGTCDQETPQNGATVLTVQANNSHNTATVKLPMFPIQPRCPHAFPSNASQRAAGLNDPTSIYFPCGYSPDQAGGYGNNGPGANYTDPSTGEQLTDSTGAFIVCDYLRSGPPDSNGHYTTGCMARLGNRTATSVAPDGDLGHDGSGRVTGNFAGIEWSPSTYYAYNRNYVSGQKIATFSYLNSAIVGQYHNLLYGKQFVSPKLANIIEDGNATRCEAMICTGQLSGDAVALVLVNAVQINELTTGSDFLFRWNWITTGGRHGTLNGDAGYKNNSYSALGDPYGSIATIEIVFYKDIFSGFGQPTVEVLATGPQLQVFTDQTTYSFQPDPLNHNPAWVLLDLLFKANWSPGEIDMSTFIAAASFCSTSINYINSAGQTASHERFKCQFALEQRKTAAEVITAVQRCCNGYFAWSQTGLLQFFISGTLADSQPSPITGSNYNTGITSKHADGTTGTGYVAYAFDEYSVARTGSLDSERPDLECEQGATVQTPNQIFIQFQDEDNQFVVDSIGEVDPNAVTRAGGALQPGGNIIPETLDVLGISNFDQATRIASVYIAERQYGNEHADARGTRIFTFGTTVRCEHLRNGHLVLFSWQALGITNQLFRVIAIKPATDYETCKITIQWHNDLWYTDAYGQSPQQFLGDTGRTRPARAPHPWQPNLAIPNSSLYSSTELNFEVQEFDTTNADGSVTIQLQIDGCAPINQISPAPGSTGIGPPLIATQVTIGGGGSIPAGNYVVKVCAFDSNGYYTAAVPFFALTAIVPNANSTITISGLVWKAGTAGYDVFAGRDIFSLTHQVKVTTGSPPSSITLSSLPNVASYGPPDLSAYAVYLQAKTVVHGGIVGTTITALTSTTITVAGSGAGTGATATANLHSMPHGGVRIGSITVNTGGSGYTIDCPVQVTGVGTLCQAKIGSVDGSGAILSIVVLVSSSDWGGTPTVTIASGNLSSMAGRYVMLIGRPDLNGAPLPIADVKVVSSSGFTLTVDRDPTGVFQVDDVVVITAQANIASATTIGDSQLANTYYPTGATDQDINLEVWIIGGTGRGQRNTITGLVSNTTYQLAKTWAVTPDSTSVFIVCESSWRYNSESGHIVNNVPTLASLTANLNVSNYAGHLLLIQALLVDQSGTLYSSENRSPIRMFWIEGAPGSSAETFVLLTIVSNHATPDLSLGRNFKLILNQSAQVTIDDPTGVPSAGTFIAIYVIQDATGGRPTPAWGATFGSDVSSQILDGTANTRSAYNMTFHDDGLWHLDSFRTGDPLT